VSAEIDRRLTVAIDEPAPGVRRLRIDDAEHRNALSPDVMDDLYADLESAADDPAVRVVLLAGTGDVFCAGGDTRRMGAARPGPLEKKDYLEHGVGRLARLLFTYDKPVIAAVNGPAVGAGMDLALWCDFRVGVATSYLRGGYIDLALPPGFGAAWLLRQLVGPAHALDILLTGRKVDAAEALALGLYTEVVADQDALAARSLARAVALAAKPPAALRLTKRLVRQARDMHPFDSLDLASSHFGVLQESDEHAEAVRAMQERAAARRNDHGRAAP
jgi:enoyl-CoA hydratase/carnithine racemase